MSRMLPQWDYADSVYIAAPLEEKGGIGGKKHNKEEVELGHGNRG